MSIFSFIFLAYFLPFQELNSNPRQKLIQEIKQAEKDSLKSALLLDLAKSYYAEDQDTALLLSNQSLEISRSEDLMKLQASAYNLIGVCYLIKSDFEKSLDSHYQALRIRESLSDSTGIMESYLNLGNIHYRLKDLPNAVEKYKTSLQFAVALNHEKALGLLYNNIGSYYRDVWASYKGKVELDSAMYYLEKSLDYKTKFGDEGGETQTLIQLSELYEEKGDFDLSAKLIFRALELSRKNKNNEGILSSLNRLSAIHRSKGEIRKAIKVSEEAFQLANEIDSPFQISIAADQLSSLYAVLGDYKKAFDYLSITDRYSDTIYNDSREKIREELSLKYESEKKELELQKLANMEELAVTKINYQKNLLIASILIALILLVLVFRQLKLNRKISLTNGKLLETNEIIKKQSIELEESNRFREKLFSIISHDLKTPLSSLKSTLDLWKSGILESGDMTYIVSLISKETSNASNLLESILTWARTQMDENQKNFLQVSPRLIVEEVKKTFQLQIQQKNIEFLNLIPESTSIFSDPDRLTLILRNLIYNAIKFTEEGGRVMISIEGNTILVQDNGIGMDALQVKNIFSNKISTEGTKGEKGSGIGLMLTKDFADSIGAAIKVDSAKGKGTTFKLVLKS